MILPVKYLDELKHLPSTKINSLDAQFEVEAAFQLILY